MPVVTADAAGFDESRVARAVRELLAGIGEDPDRPGLRETPGRVARACRELYGGLGRDGADVLRPTFEVGHAEMVLVRDVAVASTCEHHLLPFHGVAHVAYLPGEDGRVTGSSELARLVDVYARRPQVQERLTTQVVEALVRGVRPRGAMVVLDCEHSCMTLRGVRRPGSRTTTSAVRGALLEPAARAEALALMAGR